MEIILSNTTAFLIITLILLVLVGVVIYNTARLSEINSRTFKLDHMIHSLTTNMQLSHMESDFDELFKEHQKGTKDGPKTIFRTADGKYTAGSLNELLHKISNDPNSNINKDELDALKKLFDQISSEIEKEEDDED